MYDISAPLPREFGAYTLLEVLGQGGSAIVFGATQHSLGRRVALKVLTQCFPYDPEGGARFQREVKLAAGLRHPHLVTVYDGGILEDQPYLVMEEVPAGSVAGLLAVEGALAWLTAAAIAIGVARALEYLHQGKILHRDIKPANILVSPGSLAKVSDLGLATHPQATPLTQTGALMGTLPYMAPELFKEGITDPRADLWAFGAVIYEMIQGTRLFPVNSLPEAVTRILNSRPPELSEMNSSIPKELGNIVRSLLTRDLAGRMQTAAECRTRLEAMVCAHGTRDIEEAVADPLALLNVRPSSAARPGSPSAPVQPSTQVISPESGEGGRRRAFLGAALLVGLIGVLVWYSPRLGERRTVSGTQFTPPPVAAASPSGGVTEKLLRRFAIGTLPVPEQLEMIHLGDSGRFTARVIRSILVEHGYPQIPNRTFAGVLTVLPGKKSGVLEISLNGFPSGPMPTITVEGIRLGAPARDASGKIVWMGYIPQDFSGISLVLGRFEAVSPRSLALRLRSPEAVSPCTRQGTPVPPLPAGAADCRKELDLLFHRAQYSRFEQQAFEWSLAVPGHPAPLIELAHMRMVAVETQRELKLFGSSTPVEESIISQELDGGKLADIRGDLQLGRAVVGFQEVLRKFPTIGGTWSFLGRAMMVSELPDVCWRCLRIGAMLQPDDPESWHSFWASYNHGQFMGHSVANRTEVLESQQALLALCQNDPRYRKLARDATASIARLQGK